jgi:uroporphyrinogen decarboxylase
VQRLLGTTGAGKAANRWLGSIYPDEETLAKLGSDFRAVHLPAPDYEVIREPDGTLCFRDEWGIRWTKKPGSHYFDVLDFIDVDSVADVGSLRWPEPDVASDEWDRKLSSLAVSAEDIHRRGFAAVLDFGVAPLTMTQLILGFENSCVYLLWKPEVIEAIMEKVIEIYMRQAEAVFRATGSLVDAVYAFADDLGTQNSLWLSPEHYRRIVKPYHRRIVEFIRRCTASKIIFHSCGAVYPFIPDLLEIGIDVLNPVQVSAGGMDPLRLKREFGNDLVFWGGIDTQHVLPHGSPEEVRAEVRRRIDALSGSGGYVLAPVHNIQPDVSAENVWAMVCEAKRYRKAL